MSQSALAAVAVAFLISVVVADAVRRAALALGVVDVPTTRSAHTSARSRSGGLAIVIAVPLAAATARWFGITIDSGYWWAIALATALSLVGLIDDVRPLDYRPRLLAQIAAAVALVLAVGPAAGIVVPGIAGPVRVDLVPSAAMVLTVVGVVAVTNAFNFMDGIDALVAVQVVVGATLLAAMQEPAGGTVVSLAIAGAAAGFLVHNRPPARIFLGDVGSLYLGFLLSAIMIAGEHQLSVSASLAALVFLPLGVDTFLTLASRLYRGEAWYAPHSQHAYQRLVAHGWSHMRTATIYGLLTLTSGALVLMTVRAGDYGWVWWFAASAIFLFVAAPASRRARDILRGSLPPVRTDGES